MIQRKCLLLLCLLGSVLGNLPCPLFSLECIGIEFIVGVNQVSYHYQNINRPLRYIQTCLDELVNIKPDFNISIHVTSDKSASNQVVTDSVCFRRDDGSIRFNFNECTGVNNVDPVRVFNINISF